MFPGFTFLGRYFSSYTIVALIGTMAAGVFAIRQYAKKGGEAYQMLITLLLSSIGIFAGGCLLYGITNIELWYLIFSAKDFSEFISAVTTIFGGSVFYGGLLGGMAAGFIAIKLRRLPTDAVTDCAAPAVALFHGFGRIGCFLGGCCYGIECEHGVVFEHSAIASANGVPRFPVQLVESGFEFLLFFALWYLLRKGRARGFLFPIYLAVYAVGRFLLEFLRGDAYRGFIFGLSTSQFISVLLFAGAITAIAVKLGRAARKPSERA